MRAGILLYPAWCRFRQSATGRGNSNQQKIRYGLLGISLCIILLGVFRGMRWLLTELSSSALLASLIPDVVLDLFLLSMVSIGFISNLASCLGILFFADDLELILASPIRAISFLLGRLARVWLHSSWMPLVFCIPVITAIGIHTGAPLLFYLASALLIPVILAIPTLIAALFAIPLTLTLPYLAVRGTKILLAGFGGIIVLLGFLILPSLISEVTSADRMARIIYHLTRPDARFLPIRWVSAVLSALAVGSPLPFTAYFLLIGSLLGAGISLNFLIYTATYPRAYALIKTASNTSEAAFPLSRLIARAFRRASPPSRAVIIAEVGSIIREWSSLFEICLLLLLGSAYLSNVKLYSVTTTFSGAEQLRLERVLSSINFLIATFFGIACASRLIFPSVSRDGRAAWLLYTSPVTIEQILRTKFRFWFTILAIIMATFLALSSYLTVSSIQLALVNGAFGLIVAYGISGIAIGLGGEYANFTWEHISQLAASLGSFLCMLTAVTYLGICGAVLELFRHVPQQLLPVSPTVRTVFMPTLGLTVNVLISVAVTRRYLSRACRHLSNDLR